jgi:hypothetical protein
MRVKWRYLIGGAGVAALSFVTNLETEIATARPGSEIPATEPAAYGRPLFDRTHKGDRMAPRLRPSVAPATPPRLLDGCESSFSMISSSSSRAIAGRCIASAPAGEIQFG